MAGTGQPDWSGLLKWSVEHSDGTSKARVFTAEEKRWFADAVKENTVDEVEIMKLIGSFLVKESEEGVSEEELVETKEDLLEELMAIVDQIDRARDLKVIGGFQTVVELLNSKHEGLRSRAAELVSIVVQNHPEVQEWAMDFGVLPVLVALLKDDKPAVVVKTLLALSSLIQNAPAGIAALKEHNGVGLVCGLIVAAEDRKTQVKAMRLLGYLCATPVDCTEAMAEGEIVTATVEAISSEEHQLREAALTVLSYWISNAKPLLQEKASQLKAILEARLAAIEALEGEDREAVTEEEDLCVLILEQL